MFQYRGDILKELQNKSVQAQHVNLSITVPV